MVTGWSWSTSVRIWSLLVSSRRPKASQRGGEAEEEQALRHGWEEVQLVEHGVGVGIVPETTSRRAVKAMGIRVIDANDGGPIGFGRGVIRYFGRIISAIPLGLGYWWMLWDPEKQCWHDKFASDYVVPESAYPIR